MLERSDCPLVIDLDGTLINHGLLIETFYCGIGSERLGDGPESECG